MATLTMTDMIQSITFNEITTAIKELPEVISNLPDLLNACGPTELEPHVEVLDATAMGSPQLGPLSMGLPHAEVPLSTVVAGVEGSPQGSPQPLESVGKEVISTW